MNLETIKPTIAGLTGTGLMAITPDQISEGTNIFVALATVIFQLLTFFKRKKAA